MRSAICYANKEIHFRSTKDQRNHGMGTTVTAAMVMADEAVVANVGDSRVYHFSQGKLKTNHKDHSFVQQLVDKKLITHIKKQKSIRNATLLPALWERPKELSWTLLS